MNLFGLEVVNENCLLLFDAEVAVEDDVGDVDELESILIEKLKKYIKNLNN
jgi:hypothetical protein